MGGPANRRAVSPRWCRSTLCETDMNFKSFVYYCALCGGWAAFIAWAVVTFTRVVAVDNRYVKAAILAAILGALIAGVIGMLDALLNSVGAQRFLRVLICAGVGLIASPFGALIGEALYDKASLPKFIGWMIVGVVIGASIGVFDILRALQAGQGQSQALRKTINGVIGGAIGGFLGGFLFGTLDYIPWPLDTSLYAKEKLQYSSLAAGLVILGMCIGLLIGLAQVLLKEAWVKVEQGFRAGREMILSKPDTTVGRAETCDIGLFGDNAVEKMHAHIVLKSGRYMLLDSGTPAGTFLNGSRISGPTPLSSGDRINVGRNVLRFEERAKRK